MASVQGTGPVSFMFPLSLYRPGFSRIPRREGTEVCLFVIKKTSLIRLSPLLGQLAPLTVPPSSQGELGEIGLDGLNGEDVSDLPPKF